MTHPISINHRDYGPAVSRIRRCRDAAQGTDAIKGATTTYLRKLSSHVARPWDSNGEDRYQAYLDRALWFNATKRTKLALTGAATINPLRESVSQDEKTQDIVSNLRDIRDQILDEQIEAARCVLLTLMDPEEKKPFTSVWWAESVVNWRFTPKAGKKHLSLLVLEDRESEEADDVLSSLEAKEFKVRHLYYLEDGVCKYRRFIQMEDNEEEWAEDVDAAITLVSSGGRPLEFIPAVVVGATTINEELVEDPILLDLVDVNISHYQNSADLEHGRHWTALPTPYGSGFATRDKNGKPVQFSVGSETILMSEVSGATLNYAEFSGSGLGHLAEGMKEKKAEMAVLGARILEEQKAAGEAAETIKTRLAGEKSVLWRVALATGKALTLSLHFAKAMLTPGYVIGNDDESVEMNVDYLDSIADSGRIQTWMSLVQGGFMSYASFFSLIQAAGLIPANRTMEEEILLINAGREEADNVKTGEEEENEEEENEEDEESDEEETGEEDEAGEPEDEEGDEGEDDQS